MKLEKKIAIRMTKEERDAIREITNIVENIFNIEINEEPELFAEVIAGIYCKDSVIHTSKGTIEVELVLDK